MHETLNDLKSSYAEIKHRNNILTSLLRAQRDGEVEGIFGRLGDLGTIDKHYDCAVTTACAVLDHIVVDSILNGEKCIAFLKKNKIGSGKFICLEKVAQNNRKQRENPF